MPKVILIEDDEVMQSLLHVFLETEGFQVAVIKRDAVFADMLDSLHREKPTLVLLDVNLYQLSGFDLLHAIRKDPFLKDMRVLMSSGMELGMRCFEEGADGFILKPYMPDELIITIKEILGD